jgi:MoaA/NifB/PqqE/SkfB family radical SAM enzyme
LKRVIDYALQCVKLENAVMTQRLCNHQPTGRSLALAGRSIAKYGLSAPQRFGAPLFVVWNLTRACNLQCVHCCEHLKAARAHDDLTVEEKLAVVDKLGAAGVPFLAIAGGEPLATRDIWPVLERTRQRRIQVSLATNGPLLTPDVVARLIQSGVEYVEGSVDSLRLEEHDRLPDQPGAWSRLGCRTFSHFNFVSTACAGRVSDGLPDCAQTPAPAPDVDGCGTGRWHCAVQPNGDVTPCVSSSLKVGSLRTQSLEQIWDCSVFGDLRDPGCGQNQALWDDLTQGQILVAIESRPGSQTHAVD